jgi:hypothetical protein
VIAFKGQDIIIPAPSAVIPAKAGNQSFSTTLVPAATGIVIPAKAGIQSCSTMTYLNLAK